MNSWKWTKEREGIQEVSLKVRDLFTEEKELKEFRERLSQFKNPENSDAYTSEVYKIKEDLLTYETESIIPEKRNGKRTPLLLLLGNPASHSVKERMFFSFERNRQEHRFWKVLEESGIFAPKIPTNDLDKRNKLRKQKLYDLDYDSPFRIGLTVFYSMPSAASGRWSGVAGLRRLFGKDAFKSLTTWEKKRIETLIKEFVAPTGLVIAFQKDAYMRIKSDDSQEYSLSKVKVEGIKGQCQSEPKVKLYCLAPTRLMHMNLKLLKGIKEKYSSLAHIG